MSKEELLRPGDMVVCREDIDKLILWSSYGCEPDDDGAGVDPKNVLLILEVRRSSIDDLKPTDTFTPEWQIGAYYVLSSFGIKGWIGAGWVVPVKKIKRSKKEIYEA